MNRSLHRQQQKHYSTLHFIILPFTTKCKLVDISCKCTPCITHWFGWRDRRGRAPCVDTVWDCKSQDCSSCKRQFNNQGPEPDACEMCQKKTTHIQMEALALKWFSREATAEMPAGHLFCTDPISTLPGPQGHLSLPLRAPDWQCLGAPLVWPVLFLTFLLPDDSELFSKAKSTSGDEDDCSFPSSGRARWFQGSRWSFQTRITAWMYSKFCPFGSSNIHSRLPWWLSGKESACQCRRQEFHPWSRKIPHAAEQKSPWTTTGEPTLWSPGAEPMCHNYWSHTP